MQSFEMRPGVGFGQSTFLQKKAAAEMTGQKYNACPCGCTNADLDAKGYCKHFIGIAHGICPVGQAPQEPAVGTRIEMRNMNPQYRISPEPGAKVRTIEEAVMLMTDDELVANGYKVGDDRVKDGDILVQISTDYRVYRGPRVVKEKEATSDVAALNEIVKELKKQVRELQDAATAPKRELVTVG